DAISTTLDEFSRISDENAEEVEASADSTEPVRHSYVPPVRSLAALFDLIPPLLAFSNSDSDFARFGSVDNLLVTVLDAIYTRKGSEQGIIPDWLKQDYSEEVGERQVLALLDDDDSNN